MTITLPSRLVFQSPLHIVLVDAGAGMSLSLCGLVQPLHTAAALLPPGRLRIEVLQCADFELAPPPAIALLVGPDPGQPALGSAQSLVPSSSLIASLRRAAVWGAVGSAVLALVRAGAFDDARVALPWALHEEAERAIVTPHLFECDGNRVSCCGGAASIDFSLALIENLFGADLQAQVCEALCVERVRSGDERQRIALRARFGSLQPKLTEAVALMEANIEEPLGADEIAGLVGVSRRQLERLFKQYLSSVPSRYYLDLRLHRARVLLLESSHSIVQVGLICGFSSASHFSTAYRTRFGLTPRDERQKRLRSAM